ncbi:hypothetical protein CJ030_MR7G013530 [Morella rubra]|uniref:Uncharacterized protein n=1 Tax=Morella rubra TaxID=262757 RepID=A0A6A1V237_9ROSI|nr:hypothetical protein CJ030_MR7G013530 [Morella rubra]
MGSKKRSSSSVEEEAEGQKDTVVSNPLEKKKMKKEKKVDGALSVKPMERRKKRKALDKERRQSAVPENEEEPKKAKGIDAESVGGEDHASAVPSSYSGLPEHWESAAEAMVRELQEVQEAYERIENKDLVEGSLKLEAEKNDGLKNCAPSLRYAVRRLIRGVSSSREVLSV